MNSEKQSTNLQMTLRGVNRVGEGQKNVPKLRFKGYEDAWEQRKLGSAINVRSGKDYKHLDEGDVPVYGTGGYMLSVSEALENTQDAIGIGRKGTIDKPFVLKAPFWTVDTLFYCIPKGNNYLGFLYPLFQSINWKLYDESTGVPSLSKTAIEGVTINLTGKDEQYSIGEYFEIVDTLITLHQRKYDALKSMKKTLLSKMFPKDGKDVPEIRFKEFTDAWEQRKLGEITEKFEYGLNAAATDFDGVNQYLRITDIDDESREFNKTSLTSPDTNLALADNYLLKQGDILFARTGASVGKTYQYKESDGRVYYAGFLIRARILSKFNPGFVFQSTLTKRYENFVSITSQRSGQPGINAQEYAGFKLLLPKFEEQEQISDLFIRLDNLITLHQRKLDELKNMKKTLLQQMFV